MNAAGPPMNRARELRRLGAPWSHRLSMACSLITTRSPASTASWTDRQPHPIDDSMKRMDCRSLPAIVDRRDGTSMSTAAVIRRARSSSVVPTSRPTPRSVVSAGATRGCEGASRARSEGPRGLRSPSDPPPASPTEGRPDPALSIPTDNRREFQFRAGQYSYGLVQTARVGADY